MDVAAICAALALATVVSVYGRPSSICEPSPTVRAEPPKDPQASPFGVGDWYVNHDRTMWVRKLSWQAGKGEKEIWIRPAGTQLRVTARRLDGAAGPLRVDMPCCYPSGFQVMSIVFPAAGCWEVTATAGESELRFVTEVVPAAKDQRANRE